MAAGAAETISSVVTIIGTNAGEIQQLGLQSKNQAWRDFSDLAAQYRRAYIQSIPSYMPAGNYLDSAASEIMVAVDEACTASES